MNSQAITMNVSFNGDLIIVDDKTYISHAVEYAPDCDEPYSVWRVFINDKLFDSLNCFDYDLQGVIEIALLEGGCDG
jgi:hypothetical protein